MSKQNTKKAETSREPGVDRRLIRALGHPTRDRILRALNEGEASPSDLARSFELPVGHVAYHFRVLLECDAVELVRTAPVRGTTEHFYRAITRPYLDDEQWERLPLPTRRAMDAQNLQELWDHLVEAAEGVGFDDPRTHMSWIKLDLDEEAYNEIADELGRVLDRAIELQGEMANRDAGPSPQGHERREKIRTELALLHFLRPSVAPESRKKAKSRKSRRRAVHR